MSQSMKRRTFLKVSGAVVAGGVLARAGRLSFGAETPSAELVFKNGAIVTMNAKLATAQALAVRQGKITAVGSDQEISQHIGAQTQVIDLKGRSLTPGLIDAHSHPFAFGHMETRWIILRPPKIDSIDALGQELARAAAKVPKDQWVIGRGFSKLREGHYPRRWDLDKYVPDHPVQIIDWGGQLGVANTLALKTAGLFEKDVKDPYGGKYLRDSRDGMPNGVLVHYPAIYSVHEDKLTDEESQQCAKWAFDKFLECGITCVHDNFSLQSSVRAYVMMERAGKLPLRLRLYPYTRNLETCKAMIERRPRLENDMLRIVGIKLAVDGYPLMYKIPEQRRHLDLPMHPQEAFNAIIKTIHDAGLQVDVHAVGDRGVDWTLEAFEKAAGRKDCPKRRHRIEHFPFRKLDTIERAAMLGVPVCTQPTYITTKGDDYLDDFKEFGPDGRKMVEQMCPLKTMSQKGVNVCFGADVPAFPTHRPLHSIRDAMERTTAGGRKLDASESVSFMDALKMHTINSAYAAFDEQQMGTLEPGKFADMVVWSGDVRKVSVGGDLGKLEVHATFIGGKAVYRNDKAGIIK